MCRFKSYVVTKDLKVHGSRKTCSHEDIMQELKLEDGKEQNAILMREHVKIEVTPKNDKAMTRNLADWTYREDEPGALPEWYKNNKNRIEEAVFLQLSEDLKIQLVLDGEEREVTDTEIYAFNAKYVIIHGSSRMVGHGSSTMVGYDSSTMVGYDSSRMEGYDSSRMVGHGSSRMVGYDSSRMEGHGSSTMVGYDSSTMVGYDSSRMEGHGSSTMVGYDSSTMVGYDSSTMVGYDSSRMEGHDSSTMEIKSNTAVAICNGKIYVSKEATVKKTDKPINASKV